MMQHLCQHPTVKAQQEKGKASCRQQRVWNCLVFTHRQQVVVLMQLPCSCSISCYTAAQMTLV